RALGLGFGEAVALVDDEAWRRKLAARITDLRRLNKETLSATLAEIFAAADDSVKKLEIRS
ncbi:MAG: hypothetical protein O2944_09960, partial [Proteobacteria bacterium]|nr:hypothetical protein [Pseudomonadota bacterium]